MRERLLRTKNLTRSGQLLLNAMILLFFTLLTIQTTRAQTAIVIPNVITPNNDGVNDDFIINMNGNIVNSYDVKIYNRWGVLIFESQSVNINWDGTTTAGIKVGEGVYFYVVKINGTTYKGNLSVIY